MSKPNGPKYAQAFRLALLTLAVIAFVMVCTSIGKTGPTGFGPQRIEGAATASSNESGTVVADSEGTRLFFIDQHGQLVGVYGLEDKETPITTASKICQTGEDVFVAGVTRAEDGEAIKTEAVLKFDLNGELQGTVWKKDYEEGAVQVTPSISDITTDDEGELILVQFAQGDIHALHASGTVTKVAQEGTDEQAMREAVRSNVALPFEIHYDPRADRCTMTDYYGRLYVEQDAGGEMVPLSTGDRTLAIQSFDVSGDMAVLYDEGSHALVRVDGLFGDTHLTDLDTATHCDGVGICGDRATAVLDNGVLRIYDLASGSSNELSEVPLATPFAARSITLSLSKAYLVILFVVMTIRWLVRSVRERRIAQIRRVIVATTVTLICAAAVVFHMADVFETTICARQINMSQIASQASVTSPAELGDAATNEARRALGQLEADEDEKDQLTILSNVEGILESSFANSNGVHCSVYTLTDNGEVRYLFSNERDSIVLGSARDEEIANAVSAVVQATNEHEGDGTEKAHHFARTGEVQTVSRRDKSGQVVASCVAPLIAKDGSCRTALEVSCHAASLLYAILNNVLGILLMFVMSAASIFILSDEAIRSGGVYLRYQRMREEGVEWAEILMGRPLSFAVNLAFGMDGAFAVVIAKDMLAASGVDSTALVMGVPALAITLGGTVGTLLHAILCSRVPGRTYALPVLLLGISSQLLCFFAVTNNWFAIFVLCQLVSSACLATIQFVSRNRAGATHSKDFGDKHLSLLVMRSAVNIAGKGAAVVAGVVGGALVYVGSEWVYLAGALAGIAVIPILLLALPEGSIISKHSDRATLRNAFEFLRSPIMVASLVFGILPTVLAGGYKSFILPLFLSSAGVTKTDISCLFAMGNAILYLFSETLISRRDARGRWYTTCLGLLCLGVLFVLFSYNQAPTWAVVSVVAITVLIWLAGDWKHNARGWIQRDYGFSYDQAQTLLNTEESVVKDVQAPVLTALLSLGASTCCFVLGIFFAVSSVCYYFSTRKRGDWA